MASHRSLQAAIRRHPNFVPAYVELSDVYRTLALNSNVRPQEVFPAALQAARKAVELDPQRGDAHVFLAVAMAEFEWNWAGEEEEFQIGLRLNPNSMPAHVHYAHFLGRCGDGSRSVREARIGSELDPLNPRGTFLLGVCLSEARRTAEAAEILQTGTELYPIFWPMRLYLGKALMELGQYPRALEELSRTAQYTVEPAATIACAYARMGRSAEAQQILSQLELQASREYVSACQIARIYAALGAKDEAFRWLDKAYTERDTWLTFLRADPINDPLRSDPRFTDLVRRVGLPS